MKLSASTKTRLRHFLNRQEEAIHQAELARQDAIRYRKALAKDFAKAGFKVGQKVSVQNPDPKRNVITLSVAVVEGFTTIGSTHEPRLLVIRQGKRFLADPNTSCAIPKKKELPTSADLEKIRNYINRASKKEVRRG